MSSGQQVVQMKQKAPTKSGSAARSAPSASRQGPGEFFGEVKAELSRITWTSQEELQVYTKIVVAATFVLGMAIYGTDLVIQSTLQGLGNIVQFLIG